MRKIFPGYYCPTQNEFSRLWKECTFALDANVLLNLYRYTHVACDTLINILIQISDRLWVPHQAAFEYQSRRLNVISAQAEAYDEIKALLKETQDKLENKLGAFKRHPFITADKLLHRIKKLFYEIMKDLQKGGKDHPALLDEDNIRERITILLDGKVGDSYPPQKLEEIYQIGSKRFQRKIPPGFQDITKGGIEQYGDLILWFQIKDKAKQDNKPIIFVTDDRKEDWWYKFNGKTVGPRPELVQEINHEAGVSFYMYQADQFMEYAQKYLNRRDKKEAINEVHDVRRSDELEISRRTANILKNAGIRTLADLVERTEDEWLKLKGFNRKSLNEIKQNLQEMGLSIGMKLENTVLQEDDKKEDV